MIWLTLLILGAPPIVLDDVGPRSGVDFRYFSGSRGRHDLPEIMGGGVALIDYDGDGDLDLYLCNGGPIVVQPGVIDPPCRLYRNDGGGQFADVTDLAKAPGPSYAMGASVADYDHDGRDDLFVSGWREQRLYRNSGSRTFEDVTARGGLKSSDWSTSSAWADLDGDGDLDLYVCTYLTYDPARTPYCASPDGKRDYCGPGDFPAESDHLYRNNGDGTFTDIARAAGIDQPAGRGLGVVIADLVGDARPDIFVANDGSACRLHENQGAMNFREVALPSGVALDGQGEAIAGMGTAVGDFDGDGRTDLFVTNFLDRSTIAFRCLGAGLYHDDSSRIGLARATRQVLGFGLALVDLDSDGALDLVQANGHVLDRARLGVPFTMRPTVLRNVERRPVACEPGAWAERPALGRGLAVGDLDGDGRPDLVMAHLDAPPAVLLNRSRKRSLVIELIGKRGQPFGAKLKAEVGGKTYIRDSQSGGSYLSSSDRRLFLGTGAPRIDRLTVTWPSGTSKSWRDLPTNRSLRIVEGSEILNFGPQECR